MSNEKYKLRFLQSQIDSNQSLSVADKHAREVRTEGLPEGAIPPIGDLDISSVNQILYNSDAG